jgi:pimeloyl-ACP methyl ester carboxylesterase
MAKPSCSPNDGTPNRWRPFCLAALGLVICQIPVRGDVIILKDGYAIHGKVVDEQTVIEDKNGQQILTKKLGGLTLVDDGPRYTIFSAHYLRVGDVSTINKFAGLVSFTRPSKSLTRYQLPNQIISMPDPEFNDRWQRQLKCQNANGGYHEINQQIEEVTPYSISINSTSHLWRCNYLTREMGSDKVRKWLSTHPDLIEKKGPDADKRTKLIRFLMQAEWISEAEEEIERLLKDMPGETKRADAFREEIRTIQLEGQLAAIEQAKEAGRHAFAQAALLRLPRNNVSAKLTLKVAALKAEYQAATEKMDKARRLIKDLQALANQKEPEKKDESKNDPKARENAQSAKELAAAANFILDELHLDTASRLDLFIAQAEQAELARKAGRAPDKRTDQLLAAAITGWLMGNNSTETDPAMARKQIKARQMALSYLRSAADDGAKRRDIVKTYEKDAEALQFDMLDNLISLLPPPEADKDLAYRATEKKTAPKKGMKYVLQLPPEYQHGRAYPLLIVLPAGGGRMIDAVRRFGDLPGKNGYIVAAADWNDNGIKSTYEYGEEQQAVVTGLLRHLRRTLQVDSNKVFLFGHDEAANMALDVGASHPDLFAGIIPMGPSPEWQYFRAFEYWKNFQNLPVYLVTGDHAGDSAKAIRQILESWMPKAYPALAVAYKGRGQDFYAQELPYIFDWMGRKNRASATPNLGRDREEFRTVRASSNRFYWITLDDIDNNLLFDAEHRWTGFTPAHIRARIVEGNQILVEPFGMNRLSIWLGKGMIDYSKPVRVLINNKSFKKEMTPKLSVLLEDLYERGDRQRPYYQRIDCEKLNGVVKFSSP